MNGFKHIIQKQSVDVTMASGGNAFTFKDQLSDLCTTKLVEEIEKLFDAIVPRNKILRADKIVIDAGQLPERNWEAVLVERVLEQLSACINDATIVSLHPLNMQTLHERDKGNHSMDQNNELSEVEEREHIPRSIIHFLDTGLLPWYTSINSRTELNERFIYLVSDNLFFSHLIKLLKTNDQAFDRTVYQLNENALQSIIQNVGFEIDLVRSLKEFLEEIFLRLKFAPNNKKQMAYRVMLRSAVDYDKKLASRDNWHEYVDSVLRSTFKRFVTSGLDRIVAMLNEPAFVAFREESLKSLNDIKNNGETIISSATDRKPSFESTKSRSDHENGGVYISNAGLVLLHPFLPMLFENVGYFYNKAWVSTSHQQRALILTQYLVTGKEEYPEFNLLLNKVITGYPMEDSLPSEIVLSDFEKQEATDVLQSAIRHWSALKNISVEGLQSSFLMREGKLSKYNSDWFLQLDQKTIDILLNRIPWSFSVIKTPWMKLKLNVEWIK